MRLKNDEYAILHAFIDKEIEPYISGKVNKNYSISHIRAITTKALGLDITAGLIATLLRQRGIAEKSIYGVTHFAISDEFFNQNM